MEVLMREDEVRQAHHQFYEALNAMFGGDLGPMRAIWSNSADITQLGPFGGRLVGRDAVLGDFEQAAARVRGGRVSTREVLVRATDDLGYTTCIEEGENIDRNGNRVLVRHRATNILRREDGGWKLVHHHTDEAPGLKAMPERG
jgi:ketosteroid isomerase-like protein